jgi:hypothetical protein
MDKWKQLAATREYLQMLQAEGEEEYLDMGLAMDQCWEQDEQESRQRQRRDPCEVFDSGRACYEYDVWPAERILRAHMEGASGRRTGALSRDLLARQQDQELPILLVIRLMSHLWSLAHKTRASCDERRIAIRRVIEDFDSTSSNHACYQMIRQRAMTSLAAMPLVTLTLALPGKDIAISRYAEALAQCTASIEACWELYERGGADELRLGFFCVSRYLIALWPIGRARTQRQAETRRLMTRSALLKTIFAWHCAGTKAAIQYAREAVTLSKEADDLSLQLSAYRNLAWAYAFIRNDRQALATAQEAQAVLERSEQRSGGGLLPAGVRGGIYSTLAMAQARNMLSPDQALAMAMERDPGMEVHAYLDFTRATMLLEAGYVYCFQNNHVRAMETLEQRVDPETFVPRMPGVTEVGRVETLNLMALSSLKAKDRELTRTLHFWKAALDGAKALRSDLLFEHASMIYEHMATIWPGEQVLWDFRSYMVQ